MCREAGGFSPALLLQPWRSAVFLYFTLLYFTYFTPLYFTYFTSLYWIEADTNPGLLSLKKKEMDPNG